MKKVAFRPQIGMFTVETYEGETIEKKCERVTQTKEPISDGAEIIYTERKDGVRPEYDIRTDKWEIAQNAMDAVNASKIAKSKDYDTNGDKDNKDNTNDNPSGKSPEKNQEVTA